jgi:hypothetical protein
MLIKTKDLKALKRLAEKFLSDVETFGPQAVLEITWRQSALKPKQYIPKRKKFDPETEFLQAFSARLGNILAKHNVCGLSTLKERWPREVQKFRQFGPDSMRELLTVLKYQGWTWTNYDAEILSALSGIATSFEMIEALEDLEMKHPIA